MGRPPSQQDVLGGEGWAFVTPVGDADPLIPPPDEFGDPSNCPNPHKKKQK